ncbi:hypothetical protein GQ602_006459 [Ophiocordyceps camponoti-floridani]|uniref:Micro-fibrillar-associated protein 1 C-terminal domain-containing protein n=1 Tax=Ophiocordyceps camponoti-floridani TaxID=2030778 RepID=A0A8H4VAU1_9HYPO|nr:hypothetical protein GQ602_006459 [Ophiocordyceps camponoti-floridani]
MPPKRMTANPARPARHRAGKPVAGHSSSESDSDEEAPPPPSAIPPPPKAASAGKIIGSLNRIDLNARRNELQIAAEERRLAAQRAEKLAVEQGFVTEDEDEGSKNEESSEEEEDDDEDDDDEEEEEEEAPRRLMLKPKFIPRSQRGQSTKDAQKDDEAVEKAKEEARKKCHRPDDTTDDIDPEAEEAAWRVRELKRLKRGRATMEQREKEREEVERRRNLTAEERAAEDEAHLARQRSEKDSKGKMSYMQKYFHRGAFFQDETEKAGLLQRDIMGSRFQDDIRNREALPEYMQRRDMTKLGRKGATKYKDMRTEDTGRWGQLDDGPRRRDDGFRPDDDRFRRDDDGGPKGANAVPLSRRRDRRDDDGGRRKRSSSRDGHGHDGEKRRRVDVDAER